MSLFSHDVVNTRPGLDVQGVLESSDFRVDDKQYQEEAACKSR